MVFAAVDCGATSMRSGIGQKLVRELLHFGGHGRREKQRLPRCGQQLADALDVGDEAHVEHAVALVDDDDFHRRKQQLTAPGVIEQAPRRGDQHVRAAIELAELVVEGHTADQQRHGQLVVDAELLECLRHLGGQLAGWFKDERARHSRAGAAGFKARKHREHEAAGLTGAGLGDADHVAAAITAGMARVWIGVGLVNPAAATDFKTLALRPRLSKVIFIGSVLNASVPNPKFACR